MEKSPICAPRAPRSLSQRGGPLNRYDVKILVAGTGSTFGLGRYEAVLVHALEQIAASEGGEVSCLWRRAHPAFRNVSAGSLDDPSWGSPRWRFAIELLRRARSLPADVVIFTLPNLAPVALPLSVLRPSARVVVCTHGVEIWTPLPWARRTALRRASRVIASATYNADRLRAVQGVRPERIALIHLALPPSWAGGSATDHTGDSGEGRLLSVGRMDAAERYKGVDAVIRALPEVRRKVPRVSYTVVGEGTDLDRLRQLALDCGVTDSVRFTGEVDHEGLLREYEECDVFVLPSTGEGFGLVFLEAMSFAKPVVAVAAGGPVDVVQNGITGRLVASQDDVSGALLELLLDRDKARAMGAQGQARLEERFSFERYVDRWRETLRVLLAGKT
jgi:phosphatidyl-myo-inositol dimannoside synthase